MRHCVACHVDFKGDDIYTCPDCGNRTLDSNEQRLWLMARQELSNEDYAIAGVLDGPVEAQFVDDVFTAEGVHHIVQAYGEDGFGAIWTTQHGWGVLLVLEPEMEKARALLAQIRAADEEAERALETGEIPFD
jgi:hypothetical protein